MRLVVDTDAFCKLGVAGVFREAAGLFGVDLSECGRLPALPHMLRRGRLRATFGPEACDALLPVAHALPTMAPPGAAWLDRLTPIQAIDPGEALVFAAAAEAGFVVVSGDKRALRALKDVDGFPAALTGRVVVLEAILLALCDQLGPDEVRRRVRPLVGSDKVVQVCFSAGNPDPGEALGSYYRDLAIDLAPLVLWNPREGGGT